MDQLDEMYERFVALRHLKAQFWKATLLPPAMLAVVVPLSAMPLLRPMIGLAALGLTLAWIILHLRASWRLWRWPCPNCGKPFLFTWRNYRSASTRACRHCGLPLHDDKYLLLRRAVDEFRHKPYPYWQTQLGAPIVKREKGKNGRVYWVEVHAGSGVRADADIHVTVGVHRGGLSALVPLRESFVMAQRRRDPLETADRTASHE